MQHRTPTQLHASLYMEGQLVKRSRCGSAKEVKSSAKKTSAAGNSKRKK